MSVWKAEKVRVVNLKNYNILEWSEGNHFVGNNIDAFGSRISTTIVTYDPKAKVGTTVSGTEYHLHGEPGLDDDSVYLVDRLTKNVEYKFRW